MPDIASKIPSPPPKWQVRFARVGLVANGLVHCLIGLLAFMAAFNVGRSSDPEVDQNSAFAFVLEQPFGKVILIVIAAGLVCYSLWRIMQALKDTEQKGDSAKGLGRRAGYLFSGIVYAAFALAAFRLVLGSFNENKTDERETLARVLLEQPLGAWLLGLVGLGVIAAGLYQVYKGISDKYKKEVGHAHLKHETENMLIRAGKVGFVARGIVWMVIGYFFIRAATEARPSEAGGMGDAFEFLQGTFGSVLLGAVALGLICYGTFLFMRARYQPIKTA